MCRKDIIIWRLYEMMATESTSSNPELTARKTEHLRICLDEQHYHVETGNTRLKEVHPVHRAIPSLNVDDISTETDFLGYRLALPLLISPMTGGGAEGERINRELVSLAEQENIAFCTGSVRILFYKPKSRGSFDLKDYAPNIPCIANLGVSQLAEFETARIVDTLCKYRFDAISIHINCLQEFFQEKGDRSFRYQIDEIASFISASPIPVIVKETGLGLDPFSTDALLSAGAKGIDLAGSGGTNWVVVEGYRSNTAEVKAAAQEFSDWGIPLAMLLLTWRRGMHTQRPAILIASGGIRSGMDVLKSIVLGADLAGMALPFARVVHAGGVAAGQQFIRTITLVLRAGMLGLGKTDIASLRQAPYWISRELEHNLQSCIGALQSERGKNR